MGADFFSKNYDFGKAEIIVFKTALIYYTPLQLLIATKINKLNTLRECQLTYTFECQKSNKPIKSCNTVTFTRILKMTLFKISFFAKTKLKNRRSESEHERH